MPCCFLGGVCLHVCLCRFLTVDSACAVLIATCDLRAFWGLAGGVVWSVGWSPVPRGYAKSWGIVDSACTGGSETASGYRATEGTTQRQQH